MYPDWPRSDADLVPLPLCDGPKLGPFNFQGAQSIEFLEHVGEGLHSHVFKVKIHQQIYAIKLFRFVADCAWMGPVGPYEFDQGEHHDQERADQLRAFYGYSEPFSCECRAFGRLQEAGHEELAIQCFGYVLLDEAHERAIKDRFPEISFLGDGLYGGDFKAYRYLRDRFPGRDGRPPPIRGIVKTFIPPKEEKEELNTAVCKKTLDAIIRLQQLGIFRLDIGAPQIVGGKLADLSQAITVPHFLATTELNPHLSHETRKKLEHQTFLLAKADFLCFDDMIEEYNDDYGREKGEIDVWAFRGNKAYPVFRDYEFRNKAARDKVFTYVDPRRYNWKWQPKHAHKGRRRRLLPKPPMWIYCRGEDSKEMKDELDRMYGDDPTMLYWECRDGLIFPRQCNRKWWERID
ncbi:kinetochore Sim4 complex subunit FTA2-domain-containing protein [Xylariaceae sp. FL1272]|nr:kinetochore Sim4 complex subunit FTA2-domain-containing protein [Xylariaceae sp. FL1272]